MMPAEVVTAHGIERVEEWCRAITPLGTPVYASDLILLFGDRARSNRSGKRTCMSGDVAGVLYFGGSLLAGALAAEAIPVMAAILMSDPAKVNRRAMELSLRAMAAREPSLTARISGIIAMARNRASPR